MRKLIEITDKPHIYLDLDIFEGEIDEVANKVKEIKKRLSDAIKKAKESGINLTPIKEYKKIEIDLVYSYESVEIELKCFREQTAEEEEKEELAKRKRQIILREKAKQKKIEEEKKERLLYEQLKKKFKD